MTLEAGSTIDGRYRIVSPLGEGGMGAVYVVEHIAMRKRMALKVLHREMGENAEVRARFEREAIAAAHIDHPNVVSASDFGRTADGTFYMVLEYVEGRSLRAALEEGPMAEPRALALLRQMVGAVARAHEQGVVHRDLKPENVMLVARDGVEVVKVLDFGIAKLQGELAENASAGKARVPLTQLGVVFGTPEYISPEQALGRTVDARADLYALGVIAFEMLSGRRPFEADEPVRLLMMHANDPAPALTQASPAVAQIVARLLEKEPAARFPDARALAAALEAAGAGATPSPAPSSARISTTSAYVPVSGIAPTVVGTVPPASAPSLPIATVAPAGLSGPLAAVPRPVLIALAVVVFLVPIVGISLVVSHLRGGVSTASASVSAAPKPAPTERSIDDDDVRAAAAQGSAALEKLLTKAPKDPRILRALVTAYTQEDKHVFAMSTLAKWASVDATAGTDPAVEPAVLAAVTGTPVDLDAALTVLEGPLGAAGVDLLLDLSTRPGLTPATKNKITQSLAKPEVKAHASPAAALTLELKGTKTCDARYAMLDRASREGDARTLALLKTMQAKNGCGFLGMRDCWPCMRKDGALDGAIAQLEKKTSGASQ